MYELILLLIMLFSVCHWCYFSQTVFHSLAASTPAVSSGITHVVYMELSD